MPRRACFLSALALSGVLAGAGSAELSADGRYVAFVSDASDLVPDDTNRISDAFVHDLTSKTTERVSVTNDAQADGPAIGAMISGDGRFVVFSSAASNLVPGDTNGRPDVFVHDRRSLTTERVSVGNDEAQADDDSFALAVSADGRVVVFVSAANNLVPNDPAGSWKYFARDRVAGTTERIDVAPDGSVTAGELRRDIRAAASADGRYVAFVSGGLRSDGLYVRDRVARTTQRVAAEIDRLRTCP